MRSEDKEAEEDNARLAAKTEEATGCAFALHNAEQEVVKLQSIVDSVSLLHPGGSVPRLLLTFSRHYGRLRFSTSKTRCF